MVKQDKVDLFERERKKRQGRVKRRGEACPTHKLKEKVEVTSPFPPSTPQ